MRGLKKKKKKKKEEEEEKEEEQQQQQHFGHLAIFWFSIFVMLFSATGCVVMKRLEDKR